MRTFRPSVERLPLFLAALAIALASSALLAALGPNGALLTLAAVGLLALLVRSDVVLVAAAMVAASILLDWYHLINSSILAFPIAATAIAAVAIIVAFVLRSPARPWTRVPCLWMWLALLVVSLPPIVSGIYLPETLAFYEVGVFLTPLLAFIVGVQAAANVAQLRRLLACLSAFGTLIAIHTIVAALTGIFVLETTRQIGYLAARSDFTLADSTATRVGSFLQNPDWNGTFLAMMACLALGVAFASTTLLGRLLAVLETVVIIVALLFTFSFGAWAGLAAGLLVFLVVLASWRARAWLIAVGVATFGVGAILLRKEVNLLLRHGNSPGELSLRIGAWRTALHIIEAVPLTGIGWGLLNYQEKAEPFRVAQQYRELAHPHDSYLELGAMGGLPVLVVFVVLLAGVIWLVWKNCSRSELPARALFSGVLAATVALSVNSISINGWTLPPIACVAWLVLGAGASPALRPASGRAAELVNRGVRADAVRAGELIAEGVQP